MDRAIVFNLTKSGSHLETSILVYFIMLINTEIHGLLIYHGVQSCSIVYDSLPIKESMHTAFNFLVLP